MKRQGTTWLVENVTLKFMAVMVGALTVAVLAIDAFLDAEWGARGVPYHSRRVVLCTCGSLAPSRDGTVVFQSRSRATAA